MTPAQQSALEGVVGRGLTPLEVEQISGHIAAGRRDDLIAAVLSSGRTKLVPRMVSSRGLAALMPGGPLAAEDVLLKLEGARDALLASQDAGQRLMGSLLRRQLGFLAGEGLDFGAAALQGMLDQFAAQEILTESEATALKAMGVAPDPVAVSQVSDALNAVEG